MFSTERKIVRVFPHKQSTRACQGPLAHRLFAPRAHTNRFACLFVCLFVFDSPAQWQAFRRSFHLNGNLHAMTRQRSDSLLEQDDVESSSSCESTPPTTAYNCLDGEQRSLCQQPASRHSSQGLGSGSPAQHDQDDSFSDACCSTDSSFADVSGVVVANTHFEDTRTIGLVSGTTHSDSPSAKTLPPISEDSVLVTDDYDLFMPGSTTTDSLPPSPSPHLPSHQKQGLKDLDSNSSNSSNSSSSNNAASGKRQRAKAKPPTPRHMRWRSKSNASRLADLNRQLDAELTASVVAMSLSQSKPSGGSK